MTRSTRRRAAAGATGQPWRNILIAAVIFGAVGLAGTHLQERWAEHKVQQLRQAADVGVARMAEALKQDLEAQLEPYKAISRDPGFPALFKSGDPELIQAREQALTASSPKVLGVRLLPLGQSQVDYGAVPPLTYATLEMLEASEQQGHVPAPEVQLMGTEGRHVAMLSRVEDDKGALHGHVLIGLDVELLQSAMARVPLSDGYAELRQPVAGMAAVVVAKRGVREAGVPPGEVVADMQPIAGSRWTVRYEPVTGYVDAGFLRAEVLIWGGAAGIALLVWAALIMHRGKDKGRVEAKRPGAARGRPTTPATGDKVGARAEPVAEEAGAGGALEQGQASAEPAPAAEAEPAPVAVADSIFRKYDIRGIVGESLTPETSRVIGRAIGTEADVRNQSAVCVARDGRASSRELADALMEGLSETGREVVDIGQVPTPVLYYATHYLETGSGVMVTGSHNPPQYNGYKVVLAGKSLVGEDIAAIRARLESGQLSTGMGVHRTMDLGSEYIRQVSEDIPVALGNPYKIVIDCGNGVAGELAPRLYRALGHDVVELYCDIDGSFPNHHPDPSQPENLQDLVKAVTKEQADLGLAFDGDGDRLVVVDSAGNIIWPDRLMMLFAQDVLSASGGARIVYDVKCSRELGRYISKLGGEPVLSSTGHSVIKAKMAETGATLAGELSGHICFGDRWYGFDDALYAGARLLEILRQSGVSAADAFQRLPGGVSTPELRIDMSEGEPEGFMQRFMESTSFEGAEIVTLDGLRAEYPDGWGLVRASNTTPSLVLRFEADDQGALQRIQATFKKALLAVDGKLSVPF